MTTVYEEEAPVRATKKRISAKTTRIEKLRDRILELPNELKSLGISLPPVTPIKLVEEEPDVDPKTDAWVGKVKEPIGVYLQRASIIENQSQRPPFDHISEPVYRRLIWDLLRYEALVPEAKVAALSKTKNTPITSLDSDNIIYSVIDGLQRLYCLHIALLLLLRGKALISDGLITPDAWEYFEDAVQYAHDHHGGSKQAVEAMLKRKIRYEIFYNLDLARLVSYMVLYNTATKRMALSHQLEIMQQPLVNRLREGIPLFDDLKKLAGQAKPKDAFAASDLLLAFRAVISEDPYVAAEAEAERLLEDEEFSLSLDKIGDLEELFKILEWIAKDVHGEMVRIYEGNRDRQYILSNSKTFLLGFAAALGYVRNVSKKHMEGAMEKLMLKLRSGGDDPLNLDEYSDVQSEITSSRGKTIRTLVYKTFRDYFLSPTLDLDWTEAYKLVKS